MNLTRRETHLLIVLGTFMLGVSLIVNIFNINILTLNAFMRNYEPHFILAVGLPLGIYLVLDKERIGKE